VKDEKRCEIKSDLPERTFEFAKRVVFLCRFLERKAGASGILANHLLRSVRLSALTWKRDRAHKVKRILSANTASPAKKPEKQITGCGYWWHMNSFHSSLLSSGRNILFSFDRSLSVFYIPI